MLRILLLAADRTKATARSVAVVRIDADRQRLRPMLLPGPLTLESGCRTT